jgi:hypothetical protein
MSEAPDRFETVAWVYSQTELAILLSLFAHEDIWVVPIGRGHASVAFAHTVGLGGVRLRVHAADGPAARALLGGIERTPQRTPRFFARDRLADVLIVLLLFFAGALAPPARIQAEFAPARREDAA